MTKALSFKLALLGCVSSCLMSAAYAGTNPSFTLIGPGNDPEIRNVNCESAPRVYTFRMTNTHKDDYIPVKNIYIQPDANDDFKFHPGLVTIARPQTSDDCPSSYSSSDAAAAPRFEFYLPANSSCNINVVYNPQVVACGSSDRLPTTGDIARRLVADLSWNPRQIDASLHTEMTYLGSADSASLMGGQNCTTNDAQQQCQDIDAPPPSLLSSNEVIVPNDIMIYADHPFLSGGITTHDAPNGIFINDEVSHVAATDLFQGYLNLFALAETESDPTIQGCNWLNSEINLNPAWTGPDDRHNPKYIPVTIHPAVYCFDAADLPVLVNDQVTFNSQGLDIVMLVRGRNAQDVALLVDDSGHDQKGYFKFADGTSSDDITWVVYGKTELKLDSSGRHGDEYNFVGDLVTSLFKIEDNHHESDDETRFPATIAGRVLTMKEWFAPDNGEHAHFTPEGGQLELTAGTSITDVYEHKAQ